jgi:hypothetical protein
MNDIAEVLEHLDSLKDGWYEGNGKAYSQEHLSRLGHLLDCLRGQFPEPAVIPSPDGEIEIIWDVGLGRLVICSTDAGHKANVYSVLNGKILDDYNLSTDDLRKLTATIDRARSHLLRESNKAQAGTNSCDGRVVEIDGKKYQLKEVSATNK